MVEKLSKEEVKAIKKYIELGPDSLNKHENEVAERVLTKEVPVADIIGIMQTTYPVPTEEERKLAIKVIDAAGMVNMSKDEAKILDGMGSKRASYRDVVDIVMSAYRNELGNRYRQLSDQLFLLQIIDRDEMVSRKRLKSLFTKLHSAGELSDSAYDIVKEYGLVMDKSDMKRMVSHREKAYKEASEKLNKVADDMNKHMDELGVK